MSDHTITLPVTGMSCANCALNVEPALNKKLPGEVFALPLFALSMLCDFGLIGSWSHAPWVNWLFLALATPVQFYTGWHYYVGGFKSLRNRSANMDVLVALGSSVAYGYSLGYCFSRRSAATSISRPRR